MASEARVERALIAVNRMAEAQYHLREVLVGLAYPSEATRPIVKKPGKLEANYISSITPAPNGPTAPKARPQSSPALEIAMRAEEAAAANEILAGEYEQVARTNERAAEAYYRECDASERAEARVAWTQARDEWTKAKREWEAAKSKWAAARERVETLKSATRPTPPANGARAGSGMPRW
jgi:hypothetical protein